MSRKLSVATVRQHHRMIGVCLFVLLGATAPVAADEGRQRGTTAELGQLAVVVVPTESPRQTTAANGAPAAPAVRVRSLPLDLSRLSPASFGDWDPVRR